MSLAVVVDVLYVSVSWPGLTRPKKYEPYKCFYVIIYVRFTDTHQHSCQVITLVDKLQAKESSVPAVALQAAPYAPFEQDQLCTETATTAGAAPAAGYTGGAGDSPESYLAGARSPPSSSEDDCGGGDGDDGAFFLPNPDMLLAAAAEEDGAQLSNWAWLWNEQQY